MIERPYYAYHQPPAALRGLVALLYYFEAPASGLTSPLCAQLGQLHWRLEGDYVHVFADGHAEAPPSAVLVAPSDAAALVGCRDRTVLVGCDLLPEGWAALVGEPAHAMGRRLIDASTIWGTAALDPLDARGRGEQAAIRAVERFLIGCLVREASPDPRIAAVNHWLGSGSRRLDTLTRLLDVSASQAARITLASHGATPRTLGLKYRTLRAAAQLASGEAGIAEAAAAEFADQPHFTRAFSRFVGTTPGEFRQGGAVIARDVLRRRWLAAADHPLALLG